MEVVRADDHCVGAGHLLEVLHEDVRTGRVDDLAHAAGRHVHVRLEVLVAVAQVVLVDDLEHLAGAHDLPLRLARGERVFQLEAESAGEDLVLDVFGKHRQDRDRVDLVKVHVRIDVGAGRRDSSGGTCGQGDQCQEAEPKGNALLHLTLLLKRFPREYSVD